MVFTEDMLDFLYILSLILAVCALVPALAHALELPGKLRLAKDAYFAVQPIYYPGFTIVGVAEPLAAVCTAGLLGLLPPGGVEFWLTLVALVGLACMHAVYWLVTHPVNQFWVRGEQMGRVGSGFFGLGSAGRRRRAQVDWTAARDRWEYSHVARAALGSVSFLALVLLRVS